MIELKKEPRRIMIATSVSRQLLLGAAVILVASCVSVPQPPRKFVVGDFKETYSYLPSGSKIYNVPIGPDQDDPGDYPGFVLFGSVQFARSDVKVISVGLEKRFKGENTEINSSFVSDNNYIVFDQSPGEFFLKRLEVVYGSRPYTLIPSNSDEYFMFATSKNMEAGLQFEGRKGLYYVVGGTIKLAAGKLSDSTQSGEFDVLLSTMDTSYTRKFQDLPSDARLYRWSRVLEIINDDPNWKTY